MVIATEILTDGQKLEMDGIVELYEILLYPTGFLYLKNNNEVTWQGKTYEATGIKMGEVSRSVTEEASRPTLQVVNPEGVFSALVASGVLEGATVTRHRVLRAHIEADLNIKISQVWKISRVATLSRQGIQFELRSQLDGQFFILPGRQFLSPDFPTVTLS